MKAPEFETSLFVSDGWTGPKRYFVDSLDKLPDGRYSCSRAVARLIVKSYLGRDASIPSAGRAKRLTSGSDDVSIEVIDYGQAPVVSDVYILKRTLVQPEVTL